MAAKRPPLPVLALCAGLALVLLSLGRLPNADASLTNYSSTLYLSGATSTLLSGSNTLLTAAGPGQPAGTPTATAGTAGVLLGTYSYAYTVVDPSGGETAVSPTSNAVIISSTSKQVTVGGLPTGVTVRLYRQKSTGLFTRITELASNGSATYTDNMDDATAAAQPVLPQSQNRSATGAGGLGYQDFSPGVYAPFSGATAMDTSTLTTPNGKGWIVDAGGAVSFQQGQWQFKVKVKENGTVSLLGTAHLVVGMWKVTVSGGSITGSTLLVDPTCSVAASCPATAPGENTTQFITASGSSTITQSPTLNAFSLASGEHLYVEFWRRQTAAASTTSGATATLFAYDGTAQITHPTANGFPNVPGLGTVAARVNTTTPQLSATFSDPDAADTGKLTFQLCANSTCTAAGDPFTSFNSSSTTLANGATDTETVPAGANLVNGGTYYWRASATDSAANSSDPSGTSSFTVDMTPADVPALVSPATATRVNTTQLRATFTDLPAGPANTGTVEFELCSNVSCSSFVTYTSGSTTSGSDATWTPAVGADGTYYWRARAQDLAGNAPSSWSAVRSFRLDTTVPAVPTLTGVGSLLTAIPQLSAKFSDPDADDTGTVSFEVCSDSGCTSGVVPGSADGVANNTNGSWTPTGLADGHYYWQAQAQDAAGNASAWSATQQFTLDMLAPTVPVLGAVTARSTNATPLLSTSFSDPDSWDTGSLSLELCSNSSCTHVLQSGSASGLGNGAPWSWTPTSLAQGTYYWHVRAQDSAGNLSSWSAASSFVVDTTPANVPALVSPATAARVNTTQLRATFTDLPAGAANTGTVEFQLCSNATCASVVTSTVSGSTASGSDATWTPSGVADGTYYWRARAQDVAGNAASSWTATRSFTLDTNAPAIPSLGGPADAAYLAARPTLSATFVSADAGDSGSLSFQICADSGCATVVASGTSSTGLATGASGTWTPSSLGGGSYYWRAAAQDAAGNQSTWSASRSFTLDTTPPAVPTLGGPAGGMRAGRIPSLTATYSDAGAAGSGSITFQLCTTSSCSAPVASTTFTGLTSNASASWDPGPADGSYYWRARAADAAGNQSAWSGTLSFTLDRRPPAAPTLAGAPDAHVRTAPLLTAQVDDPADPGDSVRMLVQLCSDPVCAASITYAYTATVAVGTAASWQAPPLSDGVYYWRASAEDIAGNQSGWSAVHSFAIDTSPPSVPSATAPLDGTVARSARLSATFDSSDPAETGTVGFQVCADPACNVPVSSGVSGPVDAGSTASWIALGLPDGRYFWRGHAQDEAGNDSGWSPTQGFMLDQTTLGAPRLLTGTIVGSTLTLRWRPPAGGRRVSAYALIVNGARVLRLGADAVVVRVHLQQHDNRLFAIAAVDSAGMIGPATAVFRPGAQKVVKKATDASPAGRPKPRA